MSCPYGTDEEIQNSVTRTLESFNTLHQDVKSSSLAIQQQQIAKLMSQKKSLTQQLQDMKTAIDTYDREFNQRMENPTKKKMFSTIQDWILAIFFITYGLMVLSLCFTIKFNLFSFILFVLAMLSLTMSVVFMIQKMA
jgi:hypothetical protein